MGFLILSLLALAVGPSLPRLLRGHGHALAALDGFFMAAIVGVVAFHILPHSLAAGGVIMVVPALAGLWAPGWLESRGGRHHDGGRGRRGLVLLVALGLAVHAAIDGAALGIHGGHGAGHDHDHAEGSMVVLGVLLHRIPDGLAVWAMTAPVWGVRGAVISLAGIAVATVLGYAAGGAVMSDLQGAPLAAFQALIAGTLLHVVVGHRLPALEQGATHRVTAALGALGGVAGHLLLLDAHALPAVAASLTSERTLLALAVVAAPAVLIGTALVALAAGLSQRVRNRGGAPVDRAPGVGREVVMALLHGFGADRLREARPVLGPWAFALSWVMLGPVVTVARVGVSVAATLASVAAGRAAAGRGGAAAPDGIGWGARTLGAVEHEAPWLLVGLLLAAFLEPILPCAALAAVPALWQSAIAVALAAPGYLSAAGLTPVAAVLLHKGAAPGAVVALLVVGPLVSLVRSGRAEGPAVRRRWAAVAAALAAWAAAIGLDAAMGPSDPVALHHRASLEIGPLGVIGVAAVAFLGLVALFRLGPRGFVAEVTGHGEDAHTHGEHEREA